VQWLIRVSLRPMCAPCAHHGWRLIWPDRVGRVAAKPREALWRVVRAHECASRSLMGQMFANGQRKVAMNRQVSNSHVIRINVAVGTRSRRSSAGQTKRAARPPFVTAPIRLTARQWRADVRRSRSRLFVKSYENDGSVCFVAMREGGRARTVIRPGARIRAGGSETFGLLMHAQVASAFSQLSEQSHIVRWRGCLNRAGHCVSGHLTSLNGKEDDAFAASAFERRRAFDLSTLSRVGQTGFTEPGSDACPRHRSATIARMPSQWEGRS